MSEGVNTDLRDWYLSTLGIVQYRTRSTDGKQMVSELEVSRPTVAKKPGKSKITESASSSNVPDRVSSDRVPGIEAAGVNVAQDKNRLTPDETARSQTAEVVKENTVSFRLACWRPCEDLLIIDSWPKTAEPNPELIQLLGNILRAIRRSPQTLSGPEIIDWPAGGASDLTSAQEHIAMFLQGRYEQQSFNWVLAMGDDVHRCIATENSASAGDGARYRLACGGEAVFTPSLGDLIAEPRLKKEVWSNIRFLSVA